MCRMIRLGGYFWLGNYKKKNCQPAARSPKPAALSQSEYALMLVAAGYRLLAAGW